MPGGLQILQQGADFYFENPADFIQDFDRRIGFPLLNPGQIRAIQVTKKSQLLLGQILFAPDLKNYFS